MNLAVSSALLLPASYSSFALRSSDPEHAQELHPRPRRLLLTHPDSSADSRLLFPGSFTCKPPSSLWAGLLAPGLAAPTQNSVAWGHARPPAQPHHHALPVAIGHWLAWPSRLPVPDQASGTRLHAFKPHLCCLPGCVTQETHQSHSTSLAHL